MENSTMATTMASYRSETQKELQRLVRYRASLSQANPWKGPPHRRRHSMPTRTRRDAEIFQAREGPSLNCKEILSTTGTSSNLKSDGPQRLLQKKADGKFERSNSLRNAHENWHVEIQKSYDGPDTHKRSLSLIAKSTSENYYLSRSKTCIPIVKSPGNSDRCTSLLESTADHFPEAKTGYEGKASRTFFSKVLRIGKNGRDNSQSIARAKSSHCKNAVDSTPKITLLLRRRISNKGDLKEEISKALSNEGIPSDNSSQINCLDIAENGEPAKQLVLRDSSHEGFLGDPVKTSFSNPVSPSKADGVTYRIVKRLQVNTSVLPGEGGSATEQGEKREVPGEELEKPRFDENDENVSASQEPSGSQISLPLQTQSNQAIELNAEHEGTISALNNQGKFQDFKLAHQVEAYTQWINCQLQKRPSNRRVKDFGNDLRDGVVLLQLIEVIAGYKQDIVLQPKNVVEMLSNVKAVLHFMASQKITIHHIIPKEIMEGDLKATMRLVLALAAHFKTDTTGQQANPLPVDHSVPLELCPSLVSVAADAAAALAEAKRNAADSRFSLHDKYRSRPTFASESECHVPEIPFQKLVPRLRGPVHSHPPSDLSRTTRINSAYALTSSYAKPATKSPASFQLAREELSPGSTFARSHSSHFDEINDSLFQDVSSAKVLLQNLQSVLLSGQAEVDNVGASSAGINPLQAKQLQSCEERRISEVEKTIVDVNSNVLDPVLSQGMASDEDVRFALRERESELLLLHSELARQERLIKKQQQEIDELSNSLVAKVRIEAGLHAKLEESDARSSSLRVEVRELKDRLHAVASTDTMKVNATRWSCQKCSSKLCSEQVDPRLAGVRQGGLQECDDPLILKPESVVASPVSSTDSGIETNNIFDVEKCTKVLYFLGKSVTPFLKNSEVGIGFLTLRDFKALVNRIGRYRYFFKTVDEDFGSVRQELVFDDDLVPGWENKIVAWIEQDRAQLV